MLFSECIEEYFYFVFFSSFTLLCSHNGKVDIVSCKFICEGKFITFMSAGDVWSVYLSVALIAGRQCKVS